MFERVITEEPRGVSNPRVETGRQVILGRRVAWGAWSLSCLAYLADLYLLLRHGPLSPEEPDVGISAIEDFAWVLVATLALVIIRSQPRNKAGWWIMAVGASAPLQAFLTRFADIGYDAWGPTIAVVCSAWMIRWLWIIGQVNLPFTLLYYPDGDVPSPRWRAVEQMMWGLVVANFVLTAFGPGSNDVTPALENPLAIDFLPALDGTSLASSIDMVVLSLLPLVGLVAVIYRYRRSSTLVRQQIKVISWVPLVAALLFASPFILDVDLSPDFWAVVSTLFSVLVVGAITAAIVRYKLFEIDRLISRTVTYTVVVALLAGLFFVLVTGMSLFLPSHDPLVVATSTLAAAALFTPLRSRVQTAVERRFNRSRYDAELVIDRFSGTLRDQVDPNDLIDGLGSLVAGTMEPAVLGVWIRET